jgi:putative transposase
VNDKRGLIDSQGDVLNVKAQCESLGLARSTWYYQPRMESQENLEIMKALDEQYLKTPFFGYRKMTTVLKPLFPILNEKRTRRLMKVMGIGAIYPKPKLSLKSPESVIYPYLLRGLTIDRINQVWSTDITYIPLKKGFLYLVAIMDWASRYVLSWELSNSLEVTFCINALEKALCANNPEIFNTDQGSQFTSKDFLAILKERGIQISMDGRRKALDNVFIERLWRTLKYEEVYPKCYENGKEAFLGINNFLNWYNVERPHQALNYKTPYEIFISGCSVGVIQML